MTIPLITQMNQQRLALKKRIMAHSRKQMKRRLAQYCATKRPSPIGHRNVKQRRLRGNMNVWIWWHKNKARAINLKIQLNNLTGEQGGVFDQPYYLYPELITILQESAMIPQTGKTITAAQVVKALLESEYNQETDFQLVNVDDTNAPIIETLVDWCHGSRERHRVLARRLS